MARKFFTSDENEAEFNLAIGTIFRMDNNLQEINWHFKQHNLKEALEVLQVLYSEISPFLNKTEKEEEDEREKNLIKDINDLVNYNPRSRQFNLGYNQEFEMRLRKWDRAIRKLMLKYKLYMKMADNRLAASKV